MSWLLAWAPFLVTCLTRVFVVSWIALWGERHLFGLLSRQLGSIAFYGAALFIGLTFVRSTIGGAFFPQSTPDRNVHAETGVFRDESVEWAACGMRGWRPAMEDAHVVEMLDASVFPDVGLFAVLDGHGGADVSALASKLLAREVVAVGRESKEPCLEEALSKALPRLDARVRAGALQLGRLCKGALHPFHTVGTTACVAAVDFAKQEIVVANVGDSRAILIRGGKAIALSEDHKPEDPKERKRIENAGGRVVKIGPCWRVDGNLNLSRALGDYHMKDNFSLPAEMQKVSAFPDITRTPFRGWPQELLVVGCDGLFESKQNQDIADLVWSRYQKGVALDQIGKEVCHACCAKGVMRQGRQHPIEMGTDNETVVIVKLPIKKDGNGFLSGQRVKVRGLTTEAGQLLNGKIAVIEAFHAESGRYGVEFDDGSVKQILPANLQAEAEQTSETS